MPDYQILHGDCVERMAELPDASIDSIVTDPPYGLGFMGRKWDIGVPAVDVFAECLRVLKPGGHLLAFGGSRTYHRLAVAVEGAGFEIRDQIMWVYGSGFPKSRNVGREVEGWDGWGTALKPAHEPIVVARKPLTGTVAANVLAHGTGALNIDGCRIETTENLNGGAYAKTTKSDGVSQSMAGPLGNAVNREFAQPAGRWPANLIHDGSDEVLAAFPDAPGQMAKAAEGGDRRKEQHVYGVMMRGSNGADPRQEIDKSAARFFYCAKASRKDRNEGCDAFEEKALNWSSGTQNPGSFQSAGTKKAAKNHHPTVKPTELMRYLCRLVTPPGGTVLDPFMGSGSTGKAAILEGFDFIGIEKEAEYLPIIKARLEHAKSARSVS